MAVYQSRSVCMYSCRFVSTRHIFHYLSAKQGHTFRAMYPDNSQPSSPPTPPLATGKLKTAAYTVRLSKNGHATSMKKGRQKILPLIVLSYWATVTCSKPGWEPLLLTEHDECNSLTIINNNTFCVQFIRCAEYCSSSYTVYSFSPVGVFCCAKLAFYISI